MQSQQKKKEKKKKKGGAQKIGALVTSHRNNYMKELILVVDIMIGIQMILVFSQYIEINDSSLFSLLNWL